MKAAASVATGGISQDKEEAVLDVKGNPVKPNKPYFIRKANDQEMFVLRGKRTSHDKYPKAAILSSIRTPVLFLQATPADYLTTNSDISIRFESGLEIWRVDPNSPFPKPDIPSNGRAYNPDSTFKIQEDSAGYKFVYGSDVIGLFTNPANCVEHLVISGTPLDVVFVPAKTMDVPN